MSIDTTNLSPILIMAGGTGGHIFPAMAVAKLLQENNCPVTWIGTPNSMEARLVPQNNVAIRYINIKALRGKGVMVKLLFPFRLVKAIFQARAIIKDVNPAAVLGMGGFVTGPGGIAAWMTGKPLLIHEQNAVAGMTNTYLSKLAQHVYEAFSGSFKNLKNVEEIGNPIRADIRHLHVAEKENFRTDRALRLLIVGGSLGAKILNETVPVAIAKLYKEQILSKNSLDIRHQTGERTYQHAIDAYRKAEVKSDVVRFIDDMAGAYAWADIIICRAGALTVSEVSAAGVPAIFVPYPLAVDDHQRKNAETLVAAGAAKMLSQKELNAENLANTLAEISNDIEQLHTMSINAKAAAKLDAAKIITEKCLDYARRAA